ncbi:MAG: ATP-binding protein [Gaiellaceae bacterium]
MAIGTAFRRMLRSHRAAVALSLVGLALTLLAAFLTHNPQTVGPAMLLPWVALLAFELGPWGGLAMAFVTFCLYIASASGNGLDTTAFFVIGRFTSFALIAVGVGFAGKRLKDSERRSRHLVEGLSLAVYTEDGIGLTYIGPQIESIVGFSAAEWLATPNFWRNAIHPDDQERVLAQYSAAVAAGEPFECEYRLIGRDRTVWVRDSSAPVPERRRSYRQGFIVDVSAQKKSERRLEHNATLMRGLIDRTVDGIALTDRDGRIVMTNEPLLRFAGELHLPHDGLIHDRLLAIAEQMVEPEKYAQRMRDLAADPYEESLDEFELRDSERTFQGYTRPIVSDGDYLGRVWTLREVTETRQVEKMKDALLATVSHELRTPLTSIIGYLDLLGTGDSPLNAEDSNYLEIAQRNALRLQHMVEDLLFLARLDDGAFSLDSKQINLVEAARDAIASVRPLAETKQMTLELDAPDEAYVRADGKRIGQALDNLISNALKFTPAGGHVGVSIEIRDDLVLVRVTDSGCGIPESERDQLFERFFRSSSTAHLPGTGLGLAIVKAIVETHGGSITCDSAESNGTTFTFSLPRQPQVTRIDSFVRRPPEPASTR